MNNVTIGSIKDELSRQKNIISGGNGSLKDRAFGLLELRKLEKLPCGRYNEENPHVKAGLNFWYSDINSSESRVKSFVKKGDAAFADTPKAAEWDEIKKALLLQLVVVNELKDDLAAARKERDELRATRELPFSDRRKQDPIFDGPIWKTTEQYEQEYVAWYVAECRADFLAKAKAAKKNIEWTARDEENAAESARLSLLRYVIKLQNKIGKVVTAADLKGNVWAESELSVVCEDGEKQQWHTKHIYNFSCYGKQFSQWPSRRTL